ncbi:thiamine-phosphate kinase, partial [Alistipes shahii]|uniref:thiamine-phosphate kinase n=1 Tax=Alistipes shahii TaxID=328814 RepID=UPI003AAEEF74
MTEFELIARIGQLFAGVPRNGFEKPGDDCTVLGIGGGESLLFTADLLTEGIHFLRNTTPPYELGRKALAVNLSDVATMGGRSVATLLSVALPPDVSDEWTEAFLRGYRDLSAEEGVMLAGGDTTSSRHDITVNVTVVGRAADHCIKRRSDARAGDAIVVAG